MKSKIKKLLVEEYRPQTMSEYVFQSKEVEAQFQKWIDQGEIPNLLLAGGPGQGKSAGAGVLINELGVNPSDVKTINASLLKTAQIEDELIPWMKKTSFGKFKIVFLDEADRIDPNHGQKILRHVIEEYSDHVRFILTANFPNKIIKPLHSRLQTITFDSMDEERLIEYVVDVIDKEGLSFESEEDVFSHIDAYSPDIRKILNSIDAHTDIDKNINAFDSGSYGGEDLDAWEEAWKADELDVASLVELAQYVDQNNYEDYYRIIEENSEKLPDEIQGVVLLSKYLDRAQRSANQALHLRAFIYHACVLGADDE